MQRLRDNKKQKNSKQTAKEIIAMLDNKLDEVDLFPRDKKGADPMLALSVKAMANTMVINEKNELKEFQNDLPTPTLPAIEEKFVRMVTKPEVTQEKNNEDAFGDFFISQKSFSSQKKRKRAQTMKERRSGRSSLSQVSSKTGCSPEKGPDDFGKAVSNVQVSTIALAESAPQNVTEEAHL